MLFDLAQVVQLSLEMDYLQLRGVDLVSKSIGFGSRGLLGADGGE